MEPVSLLGIGKLKSRLLHDLAFMLNQSLLTKVSVLPDHFDPDFALMPQRQQHNSTDILFFLAKDYVDRPGKVIGVTDVDLCIPILTYVFGEAHLDGKVGLVSIHRLDPRKYGAPKNHDLFMKRLHIEVLHELGHTFGLKHCPDWACAMHASTVVEEIDLKSEEYCSGCRVRVL